MSAVAGDPSSPWSGARRRGAAALPPRRPGLAASAGVAALVFSCLTAVALAAEPFRSPRASAPDPQPPAIGSPAPDIPLFDQNGQESSLRQALKDRFVVLVFYIGYT